ncbi:MAG: c-type cytochrome [Caenibius sp.]
MQKPVALGITGLAMVVVGAIVTPAPGQAETSPARPAAFSQCTGCHSTEPGKALFGPSLAGVAGRRAGSLPGYTYSPALKASGLTWDAATLDKWLTSPRKAVPGTKMPFAGIADPAQRKQVVDYLMTLR